MSSALDHIDSIGNLTLSNRQNIDSNLHLDAVYTHAPVTADNLRVALLDAHFKFAAAAGVELVKAHYRYTNAQDMPIDHGDEMLSVLGVYAPKNTDVIAVAMGLKYTPVINTDPAIRTDYLTKGNAAIEAIELAIEQKVDAICYPGITSTKTFTSAEVAAMKKAVEAGILVIIAAGNLPGVPSTSFKPNDLSELNKAGDGAVILAGAKNGSTAGELSEWYYAIGQPVLISNAYGAEASLSSSMASAYLTAVYADLRNRFPKLGVKDLLKKMDDLAVKNEPAEKFGRGILPVFSATLAARHPAFFNQTLRDLPGYCQDLEYGISAAVQLEFAATNPKAITKNPFRIIDVDTFKLYISKDPNAAKGFGIALQLQELAKKRLQPQPTKFSPQREK